MAEFTEEVLSVIHETDKVALRIVKWGNGRPMIAKQGKFEQNGESRFGKLKGLTKDDVYTILHHREQILEQMG